jgi:hypothetical protein
VSTRIQRLTMPQSSTRPAGLLADAEFPASPRGYAAMLTWMRGKGNLRQVGVEGTGGYWAGFARYLHEQRVEGIVRLVISAAEVDDLGVDTLPTQRSWTRCGRGCLKTPSGSRW